jgi:peroxiredoxin (alkyl hydroperoxide reductase subunit C)
MKRILFAAILCLFILGAMGQNEIPLIGSKAPEFIAKTTNGELKFPNDFGKSWKILLSHPGDFTPVCTSEILKLAEMQDEFEKINVQLAVISTDDVSLHQSWKGSIEEIKQEGKESVVIKFPLIDDKNAVVSRKYGMIHKPVSTTENVRGVFVLDEDNIVQSVNFYPANVGRNMDELLRLVVALQESKEQNVLLPVNWQKGDDVLVPYKPYTDKDVAENPEITQKYYQVGTSMWFKKMQ